jgi:hypothetical protein
MKRSPWLIKFNNIRFYELIYSHIKAIYSYFSFAATAWFYGKKVGQLSEANSRIQKKQTQMSKKPNTNEKLQFALTHTPAPQAVKLKFRAIRGRLRTVFALK